MPLKLPGLDGWFDFKLIDASSARGIPGLEEIAAQVDKGVLPPNTPVFTAVKRNDAPYPDVRIGVPLEVEEVRAWRWGDRSVAKDIAEALEDAYTLFMARVKAGTVG
jgi:hypothetical protein